MNIPFRTLLFGLILLLAQFGACSGPMVSSPEWVNEPIRKDGDSVTVAGISYPASDERTARDGALSGALQHLLRYTGMEISQYAQMVAKEVSSGAGADLSMDNTETTRIATEGFVRKANQRKWHIEKNETGQYVAYVQLEVPAQELRRMEATQEAMRQARVKPFKDLQRAYHGAIRAHDLDRALRMIPDLIAAYEKASLSADQKPVPELLRREVLGDLRISAKEALRVNLDLNQRPEVLLKAEHAGAKVQNLALSVVLPSGRVITSMSDSDGVARFTLPRPAHPGTYTLSVYPVLPDGSLARGFGSAMSLIVAGKAEHLADGSFHDFIEARATGTVAAGRYPDRRQAGQMALETARHLAHARLLEIRDGLSLETHAKFRGGGQLEKTTSSQAAGHVDATVVKETLRWENGQPVGEATLRSSLVKNRDY